MTKNRFRPVVGIDLGTTNSAVAMVFEGASEIIELENGEQLLPSVVHVSTDGEIIVGEDAKSALVAMPERTVAEVKRQLGAEKKIKLAAKELSPTEISALILKELKKSVDRIYGPEVDKEAVITVPAYFTDQQRKATKRAGELAGFIVERIINEPTAAAMAYGLDKIDEEQHFLVYDLGGGTFDVSIVEMNSGIMEVKASKGDRKLGGSDFDWRLIDYLSQQVIEEEGVDPREDLQATARLKDEAEKAKIKLSSQEKVKISIGALLVKDDQPIGLEVEITREQFVELIDDLLLDTLASVKEVLVDAELEKDELDQILLVGGSTRIPRVVELLTDFFEQEPHDEIDPDQAVALGAAVQAGIKSGALGTSGLIVTDVAPYSMGVEVLKGWLGLGHRPGGFAKIIEKNTTIPVTKTERFSTSYDNQEAASIKIYQGEGEWVEENHYLGEFLLEGIPENSAGAEEIEVSFNYNLNGILDVRAELLSTTEEMSITVDDGLDRDSEDDYQDSVKELENFFKKAGENRKQEVEKEFEELVSEEELADFDVEGLMGEFESMEELSKEAQRLKQRVADLFTEEELMDQEFISKLEEVIEGRDEEKLKEVVDLVLEKIIEKELGEG